MTLKKAILKQFNSTDYTATVQITGSLKAYLEDIPVARNIQSTQMIAGRKLTVAFADEANPKQAVVIAVYT